MRKLITEIIALGPLRVQKVFGLRHTALVLELYSPHYRRLFLVADISAMSQSFHLQATKPEGSKTLSPFISLVKKYASDQWIKFVALDHDREEIKALFSKEQENLSLIITFFPHLNVSFFKDTQLLARLDKSSQPHFRAGFLETQQAAVGLTENFKQAENYRKIVQDTQKKLAIDEYKSTLKKDLIKKISLLKNITRDKEKCENNLLLAHDAELIRHNFHLIKRGMKSIDVMDYTTAPPALKTVKLDETLSPELFLNKIFNSIKKARRGIAHIEPRIELIKNDIDQIKSTLKSLDNNDSIDIIISQEKSIQKHKKKVKRKPFHTYKSSDDISILVGRSAKDSDELTLHYTNGNDWWFHARDVTGAHVVVKSNLSPLPEKTLLQACFLAKHFSKARSDSHAAILYTRAKYVSKKKGMAAGKVLVTQEKSLDVAPDQETLEALLKSAISKTQAR